ncbi:MAG: tRNA lysidine(34) synthetase TilS [Kiritimatiellae bacterium]|nr:tRNA lysidine(34) synthetase TilS [Kiritimatiellia bacterium]
MGDLFPDPPHRVLVACSGGMDSVYLLLGLWGCRTELGLDLAVVTCDHGLRPESGADAEWVRHLAWSLGLPCHVERFEMRESKRAGESVEMWARRLRREAFVRIAKRTGADSLALGHHMDDQAETVLMRLCRGTGTGGAAGMARVREVEGVRFVRPLLGMRREAIQDRLTAWGREWREDVSNADQDMTRNRVRHVVLPSMCREVNAKSVEHLAAFAEQLRGLESWAAAETEKALAGCLMDGVLELGAWRAAHPVLRERMVFCALERWGADPLKLSREAVLGLAAAWSEPESESKRYETAGLRLIRAGERVLPDAEPPAIGGIRLACGSRVVWEPLERALSCARADAVSRAASLKSDWRGALTAFCREGAFEVRVPRRGDRYQPMGLKGTAKVSDLLGGAKVPAHLRKRWPVVTCGEAIVWVPGFRVAEAWKAGKNGILRLELGPVSGSATL